MREDRMTIGLVAHDRTKPLLIEWVESHRELLQTLNVVSTGTTGDLILKSCPGLDICKVRSGPFGGDQQIGAMIATGKLDVLIFFEDVLTPQPHDVDVKALLRLAVLYEIPVACNRITADLLIRNISWLKDSSSGLHGSIEEQYEDHLRRLSSAPAIPV